MADYISNLSIPLIILFILLYGKKNKVQLYDCFSTGAKESIQIALTVFPNLVTMFIAVGILRSSGLLDFIISLIQPVLSFLRIPEAVVPLALMRPISGSGSTAVLTDILINYHPDSLVGNMASTMMGSTETTFYVLALYFGVVGVKNHRYGLKAALFADLVGIIASILISNIIFG